MEKKPEVKASNVPKCNFCSKSGHQESNCYKKYPEKIPVKSNVNNAHCQKFQSEALQFYLEGEINGQKANIFLDSGAYIPAFHPKFTSGNSRTSKNAVINCMTNDVKVGTYPIVKMFVRSELTTGVVHGVAVENLKYDAILPITRDGNNTHLLLDLKTSKASVIKETVLNDSVQINHLMPTDAQPQTSTSTSSAQHDATPSTSTEMADGATRENGDGDGGAADDGHTTGGDNDVASDDDQHAADDSNVPSNSGIEIPKHVTHDFIQEAQRRDKQCIEIFSNISVNDTYKLFPNVELIVKNDVLYKVNKKNRNSLSIFVPAELVDYFLKSYHDDTGHPSYNTVAKNIGNQFYFPSLHRITREYVTNCKVCQLDTTDRHHKSVPSDLIELTDVPFDHITLDYITHFETSEKGYSYVLTIVDVATRYANVIPVKTMTAEESLDKLNKYHFHKHGYPRKITTDNGRQFTSNLFKSFCNDRNIQHIKTSPMHPQSNGICERFNGTISDMIKHSCLENPRSWDDKIHKLVYSYNNSVRSGTKFSPCSLVFTYTPHDEYSRLEPALVEPIDVNNFVINKNLDAVDNRRIAKDNLVDSQKANKSRKDNSAVERKHGDRVLLKVESRKKNKISLRWHGPYTVHECTSDKNIVININGQQRSYHIDLLKIYHEKSNDDNESNFINNIQYMPIYDNPKNIEVLKPCADDAVKYKVDDIINKFPSLCSDDNSTTNLLTYDIKVSDDVPVKKLPYPVPLAFRDKFKSEIDDMLSKGIIEPSDSDYASPCIIVPKKNNDKIRIVIDYRSLNNKLVKDREPINNPKTIFSRISNCKYFSSIDLKNGFYQIALSEDSRKYTAFTTEFGLFQFKVLPFGIANGPPVFCRMMRMLFRDHPSVFTFLDDILIASKTLDEHFETLKEVFESLSNANLKINIDKSHFCVESLNFLGQTLNSEFISPQKGKIDAIANFPLPETKRKLQSFLGLTNYYRNYVKDFAKLSCKLYDLVKKHSPKKISWSDEYISSFNDLKEALSKDIKLYHIDPQSPYVLQTDASAFAIGAVLGQRKTPDGPVLPIQCISKKLSDTEQCYSTIEREAYAIVWAVEKLSFYLLGNHFVLESDHEPLSYMNTHSKSKDKLRRWELILSKFDFDIKYIKGSENHMSDCLSRLI